MATITEDTATTLTVSANWAPVPDKTYSYRILFRAANVTINGTPRATLTDPLANFATTYGGLVGLMVQAISPDGHVQFRQIIANTADTLTLDKAWDPLPLVNPTDPARNFFYRVSMLPEDQTDGTFRGPRVVWSILNDIGGSDIINSGGGND